MPIRLISQSRSLDAVLRRRGSHSLQHRERQREREKQKQRQQPASRLASRDSRASARSWVRVACRIPCTRLPAVVCVPASPPQPHENISEDGAKVTALPLIKRTVRSIGISPLRSMAAHIHSLSPSSLSLGLSCLSHVLHIFSLDHRLPQALQERERQECKCACIALLSPAHQHAISSLPSLPLLLYVCSAPSLLLTRTCVA